VAALEAEATRLGSRALLYNAIASLTVSIIGPFFVSGSNGTERDNGTFSGGVDWKAKIGELWARRKTVDLTVLWAISHGLFATCMLSTL